MSNSRFLICEDSIHTYYGMDVRCRWVIDQHFNSIIDANVGGPDQSHTNPVWLSVNEDGTMSLAKTFCTSPAAIIEEADELPGWAFQRFLIPIGDSKMK
jgi:hypothetical protein